MRPILQNLKGRSVLDKFFFENDPLDELNQMPLRGGGGGIQGKFFWSSRFELWAPQVPLIIRETFGEILGPRRPTRLLTAKIFGRGVVQRRLGAEVPEFRQKFPVLLGAPVVPKAQIWNSKKICLGPPLKQKILSSGNWSKTQNSGQNRIYPSLTLLTAKFFPLKRVLKKSKPKSDKVATSNNNNKQQTKNNKQQTTNNKRPFFLPKINKVFLRPILQNLKGRSVLDSFF